MADLSVGIFHDAVHPQAEVVKVGYLTDLTYH
jgi:hypothetical protein